MFPRTFLYRAQHFGIRIETEFLAGCAMIMPTAKLTPMIVRTPAAIAPCR
jgi:hypothetical protein